MAVYDVMKEYFEQSAIEGCLRTDLPPKKEEEYFNPVAETMHREKLEALRDRRLRHIVHWAYEHSEFYRNMWDKAKVSPDEIKTKDDLVKLPVWNKDEMRRDQIETPPYGKRFVKELWPYVTILYRSTGTTGRQSEQPWCEIEAEAGNEIWARTLWGNGARPGGLWYNYLPPDRGYLATPMYADTYRRKVGAAVYHAGMMHMMQDLKGFLEYAVYISKFYKPFISMGAPGLAMRWGVCYRDELKMESPFDLYSCQGQPLTLRMREELENIHSTPTHKLKAVYANTTSEYYAFPECYVGYEEAKGSWHQAEDWWILEALESDAWRIVTPPGDVREVPKGERGHFTITSLLHHTVPLIRFDMEDVVVNEQITNCRCGRTHNRWSTSIEGRTSQLFKVKGKTFIPFQVEEVVADLPESTSIYQLKLTDWDMDAIDVMVETYRKLPNPEYEKNIKKQMEDKLGVPVKLELAPPNTVPSMPGGWKLVQLVDNRPK